MRHMEHTELLMGVQNLLLHKNKTVFKQNKNPKSFAITTLTSAIMLCQRGVTTWSESVITNRQEDSSAPSHIFRDDISEWLLHPQIFWLLGHQYSRCVEMKRKSPGDGGDGSVSAWLPSPLLRRFHKSSAFSRRSKVCLYLPSLPIPPLQSLRWEQLCLAAEHQEFLSSPSVMRRKVWWLGIASWYGGLETAWHCCMLK